MVDNSLNIRELLEFYVLSGVDETCGEVSCFENKKCDEQERGVCQEPNKSRKFNSHLAFDSKEALENACCLCDGISTIEELKKVIESFDGCALKSTAVNTVVGDGNPQAKLMFVGEAPGADEDRIGRAFVGKCGQLLDKMLGAIGIDRNDCYICNVLPWRPPGNRTPSDAEIAVCLPFLKKQIEIVQPDYIFALGAVAVNSLLGSADTISKLRGKWMEYKTESGKSVNLMAGYHPAYLLRSPAQKSKAWSDFLRLKKKMAEND